MTKVVKALVSIEEGTMAQNAGKSLDELEGADGILIPEPVDDNETTEQFVRYALKSLKNLCSHFLK